MFSTRMKRDHKIGCAGLVQMRPPQCPARNAPEDEDAPEDELRTRMMFTARARSKLPLPWELQLGLDRSYSSRGTFIITRLANRTEHPFPTGQFLTIIGVSCQLHPHWLSGFDAPNLTRGVACACRNCWWLRPGRRRGCTGLTFAPAL